MSYQRPEPYVPPNPPGKEDRSARNSRSRYVSHMAPKRRFHDPTASERRTTATRPSSTTGKPFPLPLAGGPTLAQAPETGDRPVKYPKDPDLYLPLYIGTAIFGAIFIFVPFLFRRGENKGIIKCCIMIAAFSMWLFWVTVYIAQMNPLVGPRVENTTLAWIAHTWGKTVKKASPGETDLT